MGADQSWQFVFLEAVIERPPTRDTGHPGQLITLTIDLLYGAIIVLEDKGQGALGVG